MTRKLLALLALALGFAVVKAPAVLLGPDGQQGLQHTHERHVHAHEHG